MTKITVLSDASWYFFNAVIFFAQNMSQPSKANHVSAKIGYLECLKVYLPHGLAGRGLKVQVVFPLFFYDPIPFLIPLHFF